MKHRILLFTFFAFFAGFASAASAQEHFCELTAKGAVNFSKRFPTKVPVQGKDSAETIIAFGKNSAASDHWAPVSLKPTANKVGLLIINCGDEEAAVSITTPQKTPADNVPFGPKAYKLGAGNFLKMHVPGDLQVSTVKIKGDSFQVSTPGTVEISRFDAGGVAGKFTFTGTKRTDPNASVTFTGVFQFPCVGLKCK